MEHNLLTEVFGIGHFLKGRHCVVNSDVFAVEDEREN